MKKLFVMGNSHVGALKKGYDLWVDKFYNASFWSIPGGGGPVIQVKNSKIFISEKQLERVKTDILPPPGKELDILSFDAVLLSGVGLPAIRKQTDTINKQYLVAGFIDNQISMDRQILSRAVFKEILEDSLKNLPCFKNIDKVQSIFKNKIYIQLFPIPTPDLAAREDFDLHYYGRNLGSFLSWYYTQQSRIIEKHIEGKNIALVKYPNKWIETGFTPIKYKSKYDAWHKNEEFGKLFMKNLIEEKLRD